MGLRSVTTGRKGSNRQVVRRRGKKEAAGYFRPRKFLKKGGISAKTVGKEEGPR